MCASHIVYTRRSFVEFISPCIGIYPNESLPKLYEKPPNNPNNDTVETHDSFVSLYN